MKEEVLRLSRVTCLEHGAKELNHFSLSLFAGEIMGLIPVNGTGLPTLLRLLRQNVAMHYGYVYYRERLVNQWQHADMSYNRISVIGGQSELADNLTVADNVFVLRTGFRKRVIHRRVLRRQLTPFLTDIGVRISADAYPRSLSHFERFVIEIVKAVVAGNRLIILLDAGAIVSAGELSKLHEILRHYATKGISFLYVSQHYEEVRQVCGRAALMVNGQIAKILSTEDTGPATIHGFGVDDYERLVLAQKDRHVPRNQAAPALSFDGLYYGAIAGLTLSVAPGECLVVQDLDNQILDDLVEVATWQHRPARGAIRVLGKRPGRRDVAVIQKLATQSMLFPELSYLDNLCFMMDHRLPRVWLNTKPKQSIRHEYAAWLGADVFDKSVDELTQAQQYDLIYARILLQRPRAVICVQPFMQADVELRMHIWRLLERLLQKQIAVVILAVNLADSLSLADRLAQVRGGCVVSTITRDEFRNLPQSTPWHHLWKEEK